jgi:hypothetical protein
MLAKESRIREIEIFEYLFKEFHCALGISDHNLLKMLLKYGNEDYFDYIFKLGSNLNEIKSMLIRYNNVGLLDELIRVKKIELSFYQKAKVLIKKDGSLFYEFCKKNKGKFKLKANEKKIILKGVLCQSDEKLFNIAFQEIKLDRKLLNYCRELSNVNNPVLQKALDTQERKLKIREF